MLSHSLPSECQLTLSWLDILSTYACQVDATSFPQRVGLDAISVDSRASPQSSMFPPAKITKNPGIDSCIPFSTLCFSEGDSDADSELEDRVDGVKSWLSKNKGSSKTVSEDGSLKSSRLA